MDGAIYVITQDARYLDMLLISAASLRSNMPDLPITVFSQFPVQSPLFRDVIPVKPTQDGFYDKTTLIRQSPYERTLFLDADTYVVEPVPELFALLDRFDCAATHEEYLNTDWVASYPRSDIPASFPEFNTGVMMLQRSEKMDRVLQQWGDLYQSHLATKPGQPVNDQPFFRPAVYYSDLRIATLTREYNCKYRGQGYLNGPVKILHGHINGQFNTNHIAQAVQVLNSSRKPRVYIAGKVFEQKISGRLVSRRKAHKVGSFPELPGSILWMRARRLRQVMRQFGLRGTLAKVFRSK
ncbi:MAG: hypothetical protein JOY93_03245 [Acidobacteriales bacterium]|nr:hypothetical protein [Terriglobales bacterium]